MNKPIPAHLVVDDPERAAEWYAKVLDAQETSRIPLPDGGVLTIELAVGTAQAAEEEFSDAHAIGSTSRLERSRGDVGAPGHERRHPMSPAR